MPEPTKQSKDNNEETKKQREVPAERQAVVNDKLTFRSASPEGNAF
jgi:hypothetical protein